MFHAGAVLPMSPLLLQLLTGPDGEAGPTLVRDVDDPPVKVGLIARGGFGWLFGSNVVEPPRLALLYPLFLLYPFDDLPPSGAPVGVGLMTPAPRLGPMVSGKFEGLTECATRLKAPRH